MHIFEALEVWLHSMEVSLKSADVIARFNRSSTDRPNPSCWLNLRHLDREAELLVWESGESELVVGIDDGAVSQLHFDDVRNPNDLAAVLSRLTKFAVSKKA